MGGQQPQTYIYIYTMVKTGTCMQGQTGHNKYIKKNTPI